MSKARNGSSPSTVNTCSATDAAGGTVDKLVRLGTRLGELAGQVFS